MTSAHDGATGIAPKRGARGESAFPPALRLALDAHRLDAFGARARAREIGGGVLRIEVDGEHVEVQIGDTEGRVETWPFGAIRTRRDGGRDTLFVASEHPLVMLERAGAAASIGAAIMARSSTLRLEIDRPRDGVARLVVRARGDQTNVDDAIAAATARARRRAARRPRVVFDDGTDGLALAEHDLNRVLRRTEAGVRARGEDGEPLSGRSQLGALAMLCALNDASGADALIAGGAAALSGSGALATLAAGLVAAWRGRPPASASLRAAAAGWMRGAAMERDAAVRSAALALAPVAAEAMGDADTVAKLRAAGAPSAADGFVGLARALGSEPSGDALASLHGRLGIAPDAVRGRVAVRPDARTFERARIEQLAVGDGSLEIGLLRSADRLIVDVEQTSGGSPFTVLLEPLLAGRRVTAARVDDVAAELDTAAEDGGMRAKVQLVADRPRRLEIRCER